MKAFKVALNGLIKENPTFVLLLGMCPTLATTTGVDNAIGMGLSATAVLVGANVIISLMRKIIPPKIRIAAYVVIIAFFATLIDKSLQAFFPDLSESLGIFIPLIVVNCIIFARVEAFASKNTVGLSAVDGLATGLGFTCALSIISIVREILGNGSLFGVSLFGEGFQPALIMIMPPGGFLTLGIVLAVISLIVNMRSASKG